MTQNKILIGVSPSVKLAKSVARKAGFKYCRLSVRKFPDGEFLIRFPLELKHKRIFFLLSLNNPNEKITELLFAANAAYERGAKEITLIAPYLPYMREDKEFHKGEVVSAKVFARLLSNSFDNLITIDPHLHRIKALSRIFDIKTKTISAVPLIAKYISQNVEQPVVIGPDEESYQWAKSVANLAGCEATIFKKHRFSSRHVKVTGKISYDIQKRNVVVVDDMISTGHTMVEAIRSIRKQGARQVQCVCVHGLFIENACKRLKAAGANKIVCTNTIQGKLAKIDVSSTIAHAL